MLYGQTCLKINCLSLSLSLSSLSVYALFGKSFFFMPQSAWRRKMWRTFRITINLPVVGFVAFRQVLYFFALRHVDKFTPYPQRWRCILWKKSLKVWSSKSVCLWGFFVFFLYGGKVQDLARVTKNLHIYFKALISIPWHPQSPSAG